MGALSASTTHYAELKAYALKTPRTQNGSCEFDVASLRPTYRLLIGTPGRSNAFAISGKLGLDQSIIENAKEQVKDEDLRFERVVASLENARREAEQEKETAKKLRIQLDEAKRKSDMREHELEIKLEKAMKDYGVL